MLKSRDPISRVVNPDPVTYEVGRRDSFWVLELQDVRSYSIQATLIHVSPHAYWYAADDVNVSRRDMESAAATFERDIYPRVTNVFGTEWTPGIDNDNHITILHGWFRGVGGYFSSMDEYPTSVHQFSNQREMVYMNVGSAEVGSRPYFGTLAHELQHAVHWNGDSTEETWVNEGLSEVAVAVAGYSTSFKGAFLRSPTRSLVHWPLGGTRLAYYGAGNLFFEYLAGHYGGRESLSLLVAEPEDGIAGIDAYLRRMGYDATFRDVFGDWVVANYVDDPDGGPYSYPGENLAVQATAHMTDFGERSSTIPQYSAEYISIDMPSGDVRVRFVGQPETALLPEPPPSGGRCWWSNRGDAISSTLTRTLDLSDVEIATLSFSFWYDVEEDWDYGYVEVSTDGSATWDILTTPGSSPESPVGNSFGPGYSGSSNGWVSEAVDLSAHAGREVFLRFHYVTDEAINGAGLCFADIAVPEVGFHDAGGPGGGWTAGGFVFTDNLVPQDFIVQVIELGEETRVTTIALDEYATGEAIIRDLGNLDESVVVVAALAPATLLPASYTLTLEPVS